MKQNLSNFFVVLLTAVFFLTGCGMNNTGNETNSAQSGNISFEYTLAAAFTQVKANSKAAEVITGQLTAVNLDTTSSEVFNWYADIDEDTFTIVSNQTIVLAPGAYNFSLVLTKGMFQYAGSTATVNIVNGENTVDLTMRPVIGDSNVEVVLLQPGSLKFQYPSIELDSITEPRIGYSVDSGAEVVVAINKTSGLSDAYINLADGNHHIDLKLYDGNAQVGKSVNAQEDVVVAASQDITMDIVPLHGETVFNIAYNGGDAVINFIIPSEAVDEAGGVADLQVVFRLTGTINGNREETLNLTLDQSGDYTASATLSDFYYDVVSMSLTFTDITDNEELGSAAAADIQLQSAGQAVLFDLSLIRRAVIAGSLLAVLGVNVFDISGSPVAGAEVYVDNVLKGITGSGAFGTDGYVKLYLAAGSHTIKVGAGSNENEALVDLDPLEAGNVNIIVDAASLITENKLISSDGAEFDYFGNSVSTSGDGNTIVVGAHGNDDNGSRSGSAYIYKWNGASWDETKIIASDGTETDWFGHSVSISGDGNIIVVGAVYGNGNASNSTGSAYIYKWNGASWDETKIIASDGALVDNFGYSISMSDDGNTIVVGAKNDDDNGDSSGSAYVYKWNGASWDETKINASDGAENDNFGYSVSTSGDGNTIVVGAKYDDDNGNASGSAYIYKWNGASWDETKIISSDGAENDIFGYSLSISGDGNTVVVGAYYHDDNGYNSGSAYIYKWNGTGWDETKINASDGAAGEYFGYSISTSGDGNSIVVGAYGDGDNGSYSGSAYIYKWNGASWDETKIIASDGVESDNFGFSVSTSGDGNTIVVGASFDDDNGEASGSVYVYR